MEPGGPSPAERARTVLGCAPLLDLRVGGRPPEPVDVRGVAPDGRLALLVTADSALGQRLTCGPAGAAVRGAVVGPVRGPDRVLDTVTVHGRLEIADDVAEAVEVITAGRPGPAGEILFRPDAGCLLWLVPSQVVVSGPAPVCPAELGAAEPDPFAAFSDGLVVAMVHEQAGRVVLLAHLLDPALLARAELIAPERVDRYGLTFRVRVAGGAGTTTRLDFTEPLDGPADLPAALLDLEARAARAFPCPADRRPT